jgi:hypothetical protein
MGKDADKIRSNVRRLIQALNEIYEENSIIVHKKQANPVKFFLEDLVIADRTKCWANPGHVMCKK